MRSPISNNKGTPQFWSLLAACSRGLDYIPTQVSALKQTASRFAADILKGGGLRVEDCKIKATENSTILPILSISYGNKKYKDKLDL